MNDYIDNRLILRFINEPAGDDWETFLEACVKRGIWVKDQYLQISLGWPSFLTYVDLGALFWKFPKFDDQNNLFVILILSLASGADKEIIIRLYDQIFVECLTQVKNLPQIDQTFLVNQIRKRKTSPIPPNLKNAFSISLETYERNLLENPYQTLHDLTLYAAWERVCINLAIIFEQAAADVKIQGGLKILRECLIESFQHITEQGKTAPSFFRLLETLYSYQMRQEHLESYSEVEWAVLSQGARALKSREEMADIPYIDKTIGNVGGKTDLLRVFTLDSPEVVHAGLSLSKYTIEKLRTEVSGWLYGQRASEIVCMEDTEDGLSVRSIING